ncbi:hypothetical protein [Bacteroides caecigallinarum]|uniref:hypothetical protein n=1 Tax=Bacteroides caecigallinarum TaxID=1411144 RepID=UPI00195D257D|nr:hypothetical protein [Bacteroides caecigallinarum]MBM6882266.1 hypothetical protein [Bacteroides caecigallinarum]
MDKETKKDMLKTATAAMTGSAIGTTAGHVAANALNKETAEVPQEEVQQEEVTVLPTTEDITANDVHIEPGDEPIEVVYGGPPIENDIILIDDTDLDNILIDDTYCMYGGPAMYGYEDNMETRNMDIAEDENLTGV